MNRIAELEKLVAHHKALYWRGRPEISDHDYDKLEDELRTLDPDNKILETIGHIGESGLKVKHATKMLSLGKTYKLEELASWIGEREVVSTFKIDGVSGSLIYQRGHFFLGKTRGDGQYGENITQKLDHMDSIPKKVQWPDPMMEVRGEIYCSEDNFFHLADEMEALELERPNNPRNIVAGLLGRKDHIELCRYLDFQAFELILEREPFKAEIEKKEQLKKLGFKIPNFGFHQAMQGIEDKLDEARRFMDEGDYQIDGVVFSYNDLALQEELGATGHHPRYKMAFKFEGESKASKIEEIEWSVSRNGILTPIAIVEPVQLGGAKISRVTLHNFGVVKQNGLKPGDTINIVRSGGVIPKFLSVAKSVEGELNYPKQCPVCQSKAEIETIRLFCSNPVCPGKIRESILNFIQKIGIDDLSVKRLDEMMKAKLVTGIPDLYALGAQDLMSLDKVKDKLANKLVSSIQKSKAIDLVTFLTALGIRGGAYNKCEKIVREGFSSVEKIKAMTVEQLMEVDLFAEKSALEFVTSLREKIPLIDQLLELGFKITSGLETEEVAESPIKGKKICLTGSLSVKRSEMEKRLQRAGAVVVSTVSKNTDYLLTNDIDSASSKFKKAKELQIPIISEVELAKLIEN